MIDRDIRWSLAHTDLKAHNRGFEAYLDYHIKNKTEPSEYVPFDSLSMREQRAWASWASGR